MGVDVTSFEYKETAFVTGNLMTYVEDLENYFRRSVKDLETWLRDSKRKEDSLFKSIETYKSTGHFFLEHNIRFPFPVDKNNYDDALDYVKEYIEFDKNFLKAQKVNLGRLVGILEDGSDINSLELVNYAHTDQIVHIKTVDDRIRMRVYFDRNSEYNYKNQARHYANHASAFKGVSAFCTVENDVGFKFSTIDDLASSKLRQSKLKVVEPEFDISRSNGNITYLLKLGKGDIEMLKLLNGQGWRRPEWLHNDSRVFSSYQAKKIIKNLFGIISVEDRGSYNRRWYSELYIPEENEKEVKKAVKTGVFRKTISSDALPVLKSAYEKTNELREKYGRFFEPYMTPKELGEITGLTRKQAKEHLHDLTGLLTKACMPYLAETTSKSSISGYYSTFSHKWFIPRARRKLVEALVNQG